MNFNGKELKPRRSYFFILLLAPAICHVKFPALMSKSTRSNGRRSIKGLIPPVANTRRHRELISPNRGNKREAVASRRKIERPRREMDLPERLDGASPPGSNESFVLAKGRKRPSFVRLVRCGSAANEKLVPRLWRESDLTCEGGRENVRPIRRTVSWFRILLLCQNDHWERSFLSLLPLPLYRGFFSNVNG